MTGLACQAAKKLVPRSTLDAVLGQYLDGDKWPDPVRAVAISCLIEAHMASGATERAVVSACELVEVCRRCGVG